jgi:hypothetical protein
MSDYLRIYERIYKQSKAKMIAQLMVVMENHRSVLSSKNMLGDATIALTSESNGAKRLTLDDTNEFQAQEGITPGLVDAFRTFIDFHDYRDRSMYIVYHIDIHDKDVAVFWLHSILDGTIDQYPSRYLDTSMHWKCHTFPKDMTPKKYLSESLADVDHVIGYGDVLDGWIGFDFHGLAQRDMYIAIFTKRSFEIFRHTDTWATIFRAMINGNGKMCKDKFWLMYHTMLDDEYTFTSQQQYLDECDRRRIMYTSIGPFFNVPTKCTK